MATDVTGGDWEASTTAIKNRSGLFVATVWAKQAEGEHKQIVAEAYGYTSGQARANARRMAASKLMRDTLKRLASYLEEFPDCDGASHGVPLSLLIDDALAAAQPPR